MLILLFLHTCIFLELMIHAMILEPQCSFRCCCLSFCKGRNTLFSPFDAISIHKYMEVASRLLLPSTLE
ncbi:hypothetical protein PR202_ga23541 [Eleusine coracana subsp. coracana]|uniref:Secreted protein n=1 Tax=Eleusine coracana subsp. coracana TaxID=191504 RepID=A0AAV5D6J6_ELECO|nr:hypothetical protein PR202_ga23541 [Eleusine coracana subsp. coracana]